MVLGICENFCFPVSACFSGPHGSVLLGWATRQSSGDVDGFVFLCDSVLSSAILEQIVGHIPFIAAVVTEQLATGHEKHAPPLQVDAGFGLPELGCDYGFKVMAIAVQVTKP